MEKRCLIEVSNLWTRFGDHVVHSDISLTVERGEVLSLVGGSGSGKTTLLRQMMGLEVPYKGEVKVFGVSLQHSDPEEIQRIRNRWGVLFQQGALFSALSVYDNVALPLRELGTVDEDLIRELVLFKLGMVGIALALEPELLFLDEPTAGLDPDRSESFVHLIEELRHELELTVVMVTHDLDTLIALSSRVAVLCDRQIIAIGTLSEIVTNSHRFICNFFQGERGKRALMAVAEALVK